ncbi:DUF742 domain-containing protein [Amycolatopsis pigmentata]|uniref:DUF742 domain-containing protein n=1 Tax=Amycolatopsis pigmentata TaxID=450801 RepID=A0ABW5FVJ2_9PSEU
MSTGPGGGASSPDEDDEATFADVLNAFTLDSGRSRRKRKKSRDSYPDGYAETPPPGYEGQQQQQYLPPGPPQTPPQQHQPPQQAPVPPPMDAPREPPGFFETSQGTGLFEPAVSSGPVEFERQSDEASVVRPYALTGGRTKAKLTLELETLISVSERAGVQVDLTTVQFEHRSIMEECRTPRSVAEVAALLRVPLGVARVLISDAADAGLITVHKTVSGNGDGEAHFMLMERVLSGLRRL